MSVTTIKKKTLKIFLFLLCNYFPLCSFSQLTSSNIKIDQLGVNEGISHSDITSITQDSDGYIWLGSNNGLNRFDGKEIKIFANTKNPNSLPDNKILSILSDKHNLLWIGSQSKGLSYYDDISEQFFNIDFKKFPSISKNFDEKTLRVNHINKDDFGNIYLATEKNGIFILEIKDRKPVDAIQINIQSENGTGSVNTYCVLPINNRNYYIGTSEGLYYCNKEKKVYKKIKFTNDLKIKFLDHTDDNKILIGYQNGAKILETKNNLLKDLFTEKINLSEVRSIVKIDVDEYLIGCFNGGIFRAKNIKNKGWVSTNIFNLATERSFNGSFDKVNCIYKDIYGLIWIGTSGGGAVLINSKAHNINLLKNTLQNPNIIPDNYITSVFKYKDELWVGTRKGLSYFKGSVNKNFLRNNHISSISQDHNGVIWIGTRYNGVVTFIKKNESWVISDFNRKIPLQISKPQQISKIIEDQFNRIWISTYDKGIFILDQQRKNGVWFQINSSVGNLYSNQINSLYRDPFEKIIWVSTVDAGLNKISLLDSTNLAVLNYKHIAKDSTSLSFDNVWPVLRTNKNTIWVGTLGGGLNKMILSNSAPARFIHYNEDKFFNDIEAIENDSNNQIWIAGRGLVKLNPKNNNVWYLGFKDGLQSNAFKVGASFKSKDGELYFGGINGLNYFYPSSLDNNIPPPSLIFKNLKIFNRYVQISNADNSSSILKKSINYTSKIELKSFQNDFTIEFVGIHLTKTHRVNYFYKLENYNKNWIQTKNDFINFSNLKAGKYQLNIYAEVDKIKSKVRIVQISILPHWSQTWIAYFLYLLIVLCIIWMYVKFVTRQTKLEHNLQLAQKETELNNTKLDFFTNISHELRTPLSLIYSPISEFLEHGIKTDNKEKLELIHRNAKKLINLTNQLLDFRKLETGHMQLKAAKGNFLPFVQEIYSVFKNKAENDHIEYKLIAKKQKVKLWFDRDKMELILSNLLSNAFKYVGKNGVITVSLEVVGNLSDNTSFKKIKKEAIPDNNFVRLSVSDNGEGIEKNNLDKIFNKYYQISNTNTLHSMGTGLGLSIAFELVKLHKGHLWVQSQINKGTTFFVDLPLGVAHLKEDEFLLNYQSSDSLSFYEVDVVKEIEHHQIKNQNDDLPEEYQNNYKDQKENSNDLDSKSELNWNVMVIDDNKDLLNYLKDILQPKFKVYTAINGREGLSKIKTILPDIIITDVMMPEMTGLELCKIIKSDPELNFIPVILLTARTASVYEIEGIETGADAYLTKPFNANLLIAKVNNFLQAKVNLKTYYQKLITTEKSSTSFMNHVDEQFMLKMVELVESNLTNKELSVSLMAQEFAMSNSAFYKRVKSITGDNPLNFIQNIRIKNAIELFKSGEKNVSEVAYLVGITDIKYFRQQFKKIISLTPTQFMKNLNEKQI